MVIQYWCPECEQREDLCRCHICPGCHLWEGRCTCGGEG